MYTALTKSLPTMNTGSLTCLSLSPGFVVPFLSYYERKVNYSEINNGRSKSKITKARYSNTSSIPEFFRDVRSESAPYLGDCLLIKHTVLLEESIIILRFQSEVYLPKDVLDM